MQPRRQPAAHEDARAVPVIRPFPFNVPRRMQLFQPGHEYFRLVYLEGLFKPCSNQYRLLAIDLCGHIKEGRESHDIVAPKDLLELDQFFLGNERAASRGPVVHAADADGKAVGCGRNRKVRPIGAQFAADLVSDVEGEDSRRRRGGDAERNRQDAQQLAPPSARQGFKDDSKQHFQWKYFAAASSAEAAMRIVSPSTR